MTHHTRPTARRLRTLGTSTLAATAVLAGSYAGLSSPASYADTTDGPRTVSGTASDTSAAPRTDQVKLKLHVSNDALATCFPHAKAKVTVDLTTEAVGKDRFRIKAKNLQPRTDFTVFLLEESGAPFGAAEYIGDFTTNRWGKAQATFDLIVEEAFAFDNVTQDRTDLDAVGFWFADETADDDCLGTHSPVTGFDGDGAAGVQMMNSGSRLLP